jgi:hypothetical protein
VVIKHTSVTLINDNNTNENNNDNIIIEIQMSGIYSIQVKVAESEIMTRWREKTRSCYTAAEV